MPGDGKEGCDAELGSKQEGTGSAACGLLVGRSESEEKLAAVGFHRVVTWSSSSQTAHSLPPAFIPALLHACGVLGLLCRMDNPQLWSLPLRRRTQGRRQSLGEGNSYRGASEQHQVFPCFL